jgi:hypothetical protein
MVGTGMQVTANAQILTTPNLGLSGSSEFSLCMGLYIDNSAGDPISGQARGIAMKGSVGGSMGVFHVGSNVRFHTREVGGSTAYAVDAPVQSLTWVHYVWTYSWADLTIKCYVNGALYDTRVIGSLPGGPGPTGAWQIGSTSQVGSGSSAATRIRGKFDEAVFLPRVLTAAEAAWMSKEFHAGRAKHESLATVPAGQTVAGTFAADGIAASTDLIIQEKRHEYDADRGTYSLTHRFVDSARVIAVSDMLRSFNDRIKRLEDKEGAQNVLSLISIIGESVHIADTLTGEENETSVTDSKVDVAAVGTTHRVIP